MTIVRILTGRILSFNQSPFDAPPDDAADIYEAVAVGNGRILAIGSSAELTSTYPNAQTSNHPDQLIMAGFVDPHVHYPQTAIIASWGKQLIDWLNTYTFPEEIKFIDQNYARLIASRYFDLTLASGTTTTCSFCTIHPESVEAFFREAQNRKLRVVAGKTCMDRNAPPELCDTAQTAYDESKRLLNLWHGVDRLSYAITPRFSPTSSHEQLEALGALWKEFPNCLMQTHLSEQIDEVAWAKQLFPDARDYLDTYEQHGLLNRNGLYGHAIHLETRERDRLLDVSAALIHCPTSNTFIGSGLFDATNLISMGQRVGLASDIGGGFSFSMLRTMASAYEIAQLQGKALHPSQLLWLATAGSAATLHMDDRIGNIRTNFEADLIAIDLKSTPAISQRAEYAENIWEEIFPTIMMGDDRAITQLWIHGEPRPKN